MFQLIESLSDTIELFPLSFVDETDCNSTATAVILKQVKISIHLIL